MLTSILNFREILQTLGQSITRPLPDPMEFIIMDAFLAILFLYGFLIVRKIVKLLIRLVKRPVAEEKVAEERIISRRSAESAQSKAEAAKALLAASKKTKNPLKLLGRLFGGIFGKLGGMSKWLFRLPLKLIGVLGGLVRRLKKDAGLETAPPTQHIPAAPIPAAPIPAAPIPAAPIPQTPVAETPHVAQRQNFPDPPVVPTAPPDAAQSNVETPVRASDLLPQSAMPEPQSIVATTADETTLTAAFEQELRNAQQAETQLHELKVKAAATALQKGSLAAARSVEEALPWFEKAAELDPASSTAQLGLSRLYKQTGNLPGAFEAAQKAFAGTDDQQTQALALEGMDQVIVAKTDEPVVSEPVAPEPAPKSFEEIRRLLDADPHNPDLQRDLSIAYDEIGDQHAEQDNLVGALECFEASMMVVGRLAKANPDTIAYLRDFSVCSEKIGEVQNALGNREAAIAAYEESLPIVTMLANRFPEEEEYLFDLKITKDRLAELKVIA